MLSGEIPSFVGKYQNLTFVDLSNNQFSGEIPMSLCSLSNAMDISLSQNKLTGQIPHQIDGLKSLTSLSLGANLLSGSIPESLGRLQKLWYLNLSRNGFSDPLPNELPNGLPSLSSIHLSYNDLHLQTKPDWICSDISRLQLPDLHMNQLYGSISGLLQKANKFLQLVDISNNRITGRLPEFSDWLGLKQLVVSNNGISGQIPTSIWKLKKSAKD
ncbi:unnamed protein product [Musa acuminata subsp. burmannicoides]